MHIAVVGLLYGFKQVLSPVQALLGQIRCRWSPPEIDLQFLTESHVMDGKTSQISKAQVAENSHDQHALG